MRWNGHDYGNGLEWRDVISECNTFIPIIPDAPAAAAAVADVMVMVMCVVMNRPLHLQRTIDIPSEYLLYLR